MKQRKYSVKSILLTCFLLFSLLLIIYSCIGILISGPAQKYQSEQNEITTVLKKKNKDVKHVYKHSFAYVTYVCESDSEFIIYDRNAKKIATRSKKEIRYEEVKQKVLEKDASLADADIIIGYGYDGPVYAIEKGHTWLYLDFDSLEEVFYMKEGA